MNREEEMLLRELASGHCTIHKVTQALGPLSLWSRDAFERELEKARLEERLECAELCVKLAVGGGFAADCAEAIRARSNNA